MKFSSNPATMAPPTGTRKFLSVLWINASTRPIRAACNRSKRRGHFYLLFCGGLGCEMGGGEGGGWVEAKGITTQIACWVAGMISRENTLLVVDSHHFLVIPIHGRHLCLQQWFLNKSAHAQFNPTAMQDFNWQNCVTEKLGRERWTASKALNSLESLLDSSVFCIVTSRLFMCMNSFKQPLMTDISN